MLLALCVLVSAVCMLASCGHEHTWDDGKITTPATKDADGVKTFTCTSCGETKTEPLALKTTVTEEEWNAAFAISNFTANGYITERDRQEDLLMKSTESAMYTQNDGYSSMVVKMDDGWHMVAEGQIGPIMNGVEPAVIFLMRSFHLPEYDKFTYDEATRSYVYVKSVASAGFYQFNVYFEEGKVVKIEGMEDEGALTHVFNFTDYGTTTIDVPETSN